MTRGAVAVQPTIALLEEIAGSDDEGLGYLWLVVLLGESRDPAAGPVLANLIRRVAVSDAVLAQTAAEGLAKLEPPPLPDLRQLAGDEEPPDVRLWAYAIAGWIGTVEAYEFLLDALTADLEMADVIAAALADALVIGTLSADADVAALRARTIDHLHGTLERAADWQRPDMEDAIRSLASGDRPLRPFSDDWRLRYRVEPAIGTLVPTWPLAASILRNIRQYRIRESIPVRPLETILTDTPEEFDDEPCECCGEATFWSTGVAVCATQAAGLALAQWQLLDRYDDDETRDLFDLLDKLEARLTELHAGPPPEGEQGHGRERAIMELNLVRMACVWLIDRGIEDVASGRRAVLAEARRRAAACGQPVDVIDRYASGEATLDLPVARLVPRSDEREKETEWTITDLLPSKAAGPRQGRPKLTASDGGRAELNED